MTDEKIIEVIDRYEREIPVALQRKLFFEHERHQLAHLLDMFPQMREFVKDGRREKLMRWLGWVQGVLCMAGVYTLEEMKTHNMPKEKTMATVVMQFGDGSFKEIEVTASDPQEAVEEARDWVRDNAWFEIYDENDEPLAEVPLT